MKPEGRTLRISIADDGLGFNPVPANPGTAERTGFGLFNIQERLNDLGGCLDIDSGPGKGTCVTLVCPLSPTREQNNGFL
jgi:signal transduction histidine kinase